MSDTWSSIQAHKKQLDSLRERLQRRRKQDPLDPSLAAPPRTSSPAPPAPPTGGPALTAAISGGGGTGPPIFPVVGEGGGGTGGGGGAGTTLGGANGSPPGGDITNDPALERRLLRHLADLALPLPTDAVAICRAIATPDAPVTQRGVESLLQKFAAQELIEVRRGLLQDDPSQPTLVTYADHSKLSAMTGAGTENGGSSGKENAGRKRRAEQDGGGTATAAAAGAGETGKETAKKSRKQASDVDLEIESLLSQQSTKEQQSKKVSQEILELLNTTTAKEQSIVEKFRSRGRAQVQEFCDHGTKEECVKATGADRPCRKLHFRRIINKHTDESLGDCSFLNTCFHMDTCKYVHYEIDAPPETPPRTPPQSHPRDRSPPQDLTRAPGADAGADRLFPPQHFGEIRRGDGRPPLGHPHGAALRHFDRRRDEAPQHPRPAGRGVPLPLGHRKSHGAGPRVPQPLGVRASRRDNLGENEPITANHPHGPHRPLAQPRQRALLGGREGKPSGLQPRPGLRRHRGRGAFHQPQTRRDLRDDRAPLARHPQNRALRAPPQRPTQLDHFGQPTGRDPPVGPRRGGSVQAALSRRHHLQTQKYVACGG
ncbi:N(6)-adenosine-methyltransferase catalytic subunit METTL3 isoform X4 [Athene noctua]|uniref:N(6)-adenosine-methyltransferase catalytic subunit METTL3 isoform X4 n=1 Tax=Athene noctua TaxID=126797 RepID=UPI003EBDDF9D